ncbi:hypothetical protein C1Y63_04690 [Corynebacterium sp. 13CS0277]|uniref:hypothetical protein n=1 Tax=Corynebacterium sp. 13CS0277 TaxID=2071994 RepID=UPI000D03367A|nr:hypothetical protein [Corynebacterium sp. 13CS0277]PRQ11709.1 hypothetical protein C1Y63_04690 [Corynebacterium sp. 13CS0277]
MSDELLLPEPAVSIIGPDGRGIPLARVHGHARHDGPRTRRHNAPGIYLREVPAGWVGWPTQPSIERGYQQFGGRWRGTSHPNTTLTLKLQARGVGRDGTRHLPDTTVQYLIDRFLNALGDGSEPRRLVVRTARHGYRWVEVYYIGVTQLDTFGTPGAAGFAQFDVQLAVPYPAWQRFPDAYTYTGPEVENTRTTGLAVPYDGDLPAWPVITIAGSYTGTFSYLHDGQSKPLALPPRSGATWTIDTRPATQSVTYTAGSKTGHFGGFVPYWAEPLAPRLSGQSRRVLPVRCSFSTPSRNENATVTVTLTPESTRAW